MSDSTPSPNVDEFPSSSTPKNESSPPPISESSPPPPPSPIPSSDLTNSNSSSPISSPDAPPPGHDSSSLSPPPSNSKASPPSPPSNSSSVLPPPPSNLSSSPPSPPSNSNSSPPSPISDSGFSSPPPPSNSSPPLLASPPPPSNSPPDDHGQPASPPPESSPSFGNSPLPLSPPVQTPPSPKEDGPPVQTFAPPMSKTPPSATPSPPLPDSPPEIPSSHGTPPSLDNPSNPSRSAPPTSQISNRVPQLGSPSRQSSSDSSKHASSKSSSDSSEGSVQGAVIGATMAGVVIIALVAIVFVIMRRKKKRRSDAFMDHYRPPSGFAMKSDGYYYGQPAVANSAYPESYYGSNAPVSSNHGNGYGSNRGHGLADSGRMGNSKSWFTYEELMDITNGFSLQNVLGEGGFGCVYKGLLPDGREVAVKQLKAGSGQGEREFKAEVEIISRVHHRHLVSLVGYCIAEHHRLLVYEFVPNNTLEHHLHGKGVTVMDWTKRVKIAIGSAKGLAYLHEDCHPRIIHRDIKSANILIDNSFEAQVADFGLAKLSNETHTHVSTRVMGTFGYLAPEYASSGKLTDRSDVFSFGVVLLEVVTGRKPVDSSQPLGDESLVEWARPLLIHALDSGEFGELVDPRLENNFKTSEMFRMIEVAAACVRHSASKRPRMLQVVRALDTEGDMQDLTNGVKFGQSTVYESGQYTVDIQNFRRLAFGSGDYSSDYGPSGEYDRKSVSYSGEHRSREVPHRPPNSWKGNEPASSEYPSSSESETHVIYQRDGDRTPNDEFRVGYGYNRR